MEKTLAEYLSHAPVFLRRKSGEIVYWTAGAQELYGFSPAEALGRLSHDLLQTEFPEPLDAIEAKLAETGEWRGRLRHVAKDGRKLWTESLWRQRDRAADVVVEQNVDVTERVRLERHRDTLARELDHRVKNTLAVVQGLARMSFGRADAANLRQFDERLLALSEAHNLLHRKQWDHASLRELIGDVTRGLGVADRLSVQGPDVNLKPSAAVSYALAFHELGTNALKYGSLSVPEGRVSIAWSFEGAGEQQHIHLIWRETGGPRPTQPTREGFGSRLIRRAVASELGTPVEMRFEEQGLVCEFDGPVQKKPEFEVD